MDLSIIIVNWNVEALLRECIRSLFEAIDHIPGYRIEIIVVDSASSDGSVAMVRSQFPQVHLIASDQNLGYAQGNNVGVDAAQGRYLFLLNPDTVVAPDALNHLLTYIDERPQVG
ncbi:MAG: glycosyltransferase, partial [Chloroflexota bacterium]